MLFTFTYSTLLLSNRIDLLFVSRNVFWVCCYIKSKKDISVAVKIYWNIFSVANTLTIETTEFFIFVSE